MVESKIEIFDQPFFLKGLRRASKNFENYNFLFQWAEEQILDRLSLVNKEFKDILVLGDRISKSFVDALPSKEITHLKYTNTYSQVAKTEILSTPELVPFDLQSFDLIISNLDLHHVNDLPGYLLQLKQCLKPDGLLIATMFGGETLTELRQSLMQTEVDLKGGVAPRVFPFANKQDMGALLQRAAFSLPVVDSDTVTVTYENMFKLMADLRGMGENNSILERSKIFAGKEFFVKAAGYYHQNFKEEDDRIPAQFEVIFLHGWAPHESQQKPLRPGSAKNRLSVALDTSEEKLPR